MNPLARAAWMFAAAVLAQVGCDVAPASAQAVTVQTTPQGLAFRIRLVLRCAHSPSPTNEEVAADLGCDPDTVSKWRRRCRKQRLYGLQDLPRSGRPAAFSP